MSVFTRRFWTAAVERAVKSAAQAAILVLGADQLNVLAIDWPEVAGFAAGGFVLSVLTSVASDAVTRSDGPSLANEIAVGKHAR